MTAEQEGTDRRHIVAGEVVSVATKQGRKMGGARAEEK